MSFFGVFCFCILGLVWFPMLYFLFWCFSGSFLDSETKRQRVTSAKTETHNLFKRQREASSALPQVARSIKIESSAVTLAQQKNKAKSQKELRARNGASFWFNTFSFPWLKREVGNHLATRKRNRRIGEIRWKNWWIFCMGSHVLLLRVFFRRVGKAKRHKVMAPRASEHLQTRTRLI